MCGICGIVWTDPERTTEPGSIARMTEQLVHRGPDGVGHHEAPGVSLGHRRLSIIDLEGGAQPMANEDGSVWVTFNGEIYNFEELRAQLQSAGHRFRTRCDTEVLVHLYEQDGPDMTKKLRGMFAFAIWDSRERILLLARDRLGQKPLVYWQNADGLRFASELKALLTADGFSKEIDPLAIDDYLNYQYVPYPRTIFRAAKKLPPGHYAIYKDGQFREHQYWKPEYEFEVPASEQKYIEELRETLTEATRLRMISDVPLGAFLSGGIDSTIVVGLMTQLANRPVKTFSIGFPVKEFDESMYARLAAAHLGTDHEEFIVEPDAVDVIEKLAWHYDEPFADSSAVPTYYVSKLTRQHVTVALSGDAGDELFIGYPRYQAVRFAERFDRLPLPLRWLITSRIWQWLPTSVRQKSFLRRLKKLIRHLGERPTIRYQQWIAIFDDPIRHSMYTPEFHRSIGNHLPSDWLESLYEELPDRDFVTRTSYVDLRSYLPMDLMTKVDIATMANSLECRGPFLDHHMVALAGRMPIEVKSPGNEQKYLLKKAFPEFLPPVLKNRPKMGFSVPIDHWMREELAPMVQDVLLGEQFRQRGWFEPKRVQTLITEHLQRRWDHSARLWTLIMLELWARNYLDQ